MNGQSQWMSVLESALNTFGGFFVALAAQLWVFNRLGLGYIPFSTNLEIAGFMMAISMVRQYSFRRFFNWLDRRFFAKRVGFL